MKGKLLSVLIAFCAFSGLLTLQLAIGALGEHKEGQVNKNHALYEKNFKTISVETLDDHKVKFSTIDQPLTLINFWATWCVPCIKEFKSMKKLQEKYGKDKIKVIAINCDEDTPKRKIIKFIKSKKLDFSIVLDPKMKFLDQFGFENLPSTVLYYKGKVLFSETKTTNFMDKSLLSKIDKALTK